MAWKLWLDDQLADPVTPNRHTPNGFLGAKNSTEALRLVDEHGMPEFIDFDYDLGDNDTAMSFLRSLQYAYPNGPFFEYRVHSRNIYAKPDIDAFVSSWKRSVE